MGLKAAARPLEPEMAGGDGGEGGGLGEDDSTTMITLKLEMHAVAVPVPSPLSEYMVSETNAKSVSTLSDFTKALLR